MNHFFFFFKKIEIDLNEKEINIIFNSKIKDKNELFSIFNKKLKFPFYFGWNFDALYDCISDLNWVKEKKIKIIHDTEILAFSDKSTYIQLIQDLLINKNNGHEFEIWFRKNEQEAIQKIINDFQ